MKLTARIGEIEQHVKFIQDVTSWSPVPAGSVLRVHAYSYANWGILLTPKNSELLYGESAKAWAAEWQDTDSALNALVSKASQDAGISDVNTMMNHKIADLALPKLRKIIKENGRFSATDIGTGTGATAISVITGMIRHNILPRVRSLFLLIEPSASRLKEATASIAKLIDGANLGQLIEIQTTHATDVNALQEAPSSSFDIAFANAAIHHNSFNRHLLEINRVLKDHAFFVIGDWHVSMWEKPERVYWLLHLMSNFENQQLSSQAFNFIMSGKNPPAIGKNERKEVSEFRQYFAGKDFQKIYRAFDGLNKEERQANIGIMRFWLEVGKKFREQSVRSPIYFLESHERVDMRVNNLANAGFEFDKGGGCKCHKLLKSRGFGELSVVMAPKKLVL